MAARCLSEQSGLKAQGREPVQAFTSHVAPRWFWTSVPDLLSLVLNRRMARLTPTIFSNKPPGVRHFAPERAGFNVTVRLNCHFLQVVELTPACKSISAGAAALPSQSVPRG